MPRRLHPARRHSPGFRNVDLEILSRVKLDALAAEWEENVVVLYSGKGRFGPGPAFLQSRRHLLTLETCPEYKDPDRTIHAFCALVEGLSPANRALWDAAHKRFDLGYELCPTEQSIHFALRPDTLARLTALGATLAVSVYHGCLFDEAGDLAATLPPPVTASTPSRRSSGSPRPQSA